ncbi:hypothetical protein BS47DRAFT_1403093 [Hydnum rufescens UP504]|uniref:Uncharacterized protein n=1 Tax=Hydnum rufescens UP504 TaxID=1448309 RepID=A0A9P6AAU4_9AGAM|nr:hypothetical protein BS47DRAFT_1403093 [Hydnum rufescens UP504]
MAPTSSNALISSLPPFMGYGLGSQPVAALVPLSAPVVPSLPHESMQLPIQTPPPTPPPVPESTPPVQSLLPQHHYGPSTPWTPLSTQAYTALEVYMLRGMHMEVRA